MQIGGKPFNMWRLVDQVKTETNQDHFDDQKVIFNSATLLDLTTSSSKTITKDFNMVNNTNFYLCYKSIQYYIYLGGKECVATLTQAQSSK